MAIPMQPNKSRAIRLISCPSRLVAGGRYANCEVDCGLLLESYSESPIPIHLRIYALSHMRDPEII